MQRLWRHKGMRVPRKLRKRPRIGGSNNSCVQYKAEAKEHVWSCDFLLEQTKNG